MVISPIHSRSANYADPLAQRLGYQLHRVNLAHMELLRRLTHPIGLTPARATALAIIGNNPGLVQADLARALDINRASAMEVTNTLEKLSAIERKPLANRQTQGLFITPYGEELIGQFMHISNKVDGIITAGMSDLEKEEISLLLSRISASISDFADNLIQDG